MPATYIPGDFDKKMAKVLNKAPRALGSIAVSFLKQSFRNQGFTDAGLKPWAKRKNDKDPGRAILVKSGRLRNSIHVIKADTNEIVKDKNFFNSSFNYQLTIKKP